MPSVMPRNGMMRSNPQRRLIVEGRKYHFVRVLNWREHAIVTLILVGLIVLIAVIVIASYVIDPFLRARIEREMNLSMQGHRASLGHAHLGVGGALLLKNLTIIQIAHSSPPLVHLADLHISILWSALIRGRIAVDCTIG